MQALQKGFWPKSSQLATRTRNPWLGGAISSLFVGIERKRQASCLGGDGSDRAGHLDHSANRLRSKSSRVPGLGGVCFRRHTGAFLKQRRRERSRRDNSLQDDALGRVQEGERGLPPDLYDT